MVNLLPLYKNTASDCNVDLSVVADEDLKLGSYLVSEIIHPLVLLKSKRPPQPKMKLQYRL